MLATYLRTTLRGKLGSGIRYETRSVSASGHRAGDSERASRKQPTRGSQHTSVPHSTHAGLTASRVRRRVALQSKLKTKRSGVRVYIHIQMYSSVSSPDTNTCCRSSVLCRCCRKFPSSGPAPTNLRPLRTRDCRRHFARSTASATEPLDL